jgi:hypothetical protein
MRNENDVKAIWTPEEGWRGERPEGEVTEMSKKQDGETRDQNEAERAVAEHRENADHTLEEQFTALRRMQAEGCSTGKLRKALEELLFGVRSLAKSDADAYVVGRSVGHYLDALEVLRKLEHALADGRLRWTDE